MLLCMGPLVSEILEMVFDPEKGINYLGYRCTFTIPSG